MLFRTMSIKNKSKAMALKGSVKLGHPNWFIFPRVRIAWILFLLSLFGVAREKWGDCRFKRKKK